jgi:hypothetical protein
MAQETEVVIDGQTDLASKIVPENDLRRLDVSMLGILVRVRD